MVGGPREAREASKGVPANSRDWRVKLWALFQVSSLVHSLGLGFPPGKWDKPRNMPYLVLAGPEKTLARHQQKACRTAEELGGSALHILQADHMDPRVPPPRLA